MTLGSVSKVGGRGHFWEVKWKVGSTTSATGQNRNLACLEPHPDLTLGQAISEIERSNLKALEQALETQQTSRRSSQQGLVINKQD